MFNLAYLLDLEWSLSQTFYLVKSKSTRAIHSLGCYTLKQTKITALKNSLLACSFCNNFSRCHVAETFYSIWCVIKELARDGSNYLRPEIWPVDHMVNCGIHHTGIVEYSPTRAISNYYNDLMLQKHEISSNKNIWACILPKMDTQHISKCSMYYPFRSFW